jgi:CheY-like chemotaxis protein/anti-sigma regulatory factor (Ser/Thr protein kinase)
MAVKRALKPSRESMETILVVDDSMKARDVAAACLVNHGMKPLFAENGRRALEIIAETAPDAVLTDLNMPEMNGLELVEHMRREYANIPVVLMTSRGGEDAAVKALRAGALSYVPKKELRGSLCDAMRTVRVAVEATRRSGDAHATGDGESTFILGCEPHGTTALVSLLQEDLKQLSCCDETDIFQVGTALGEAFTNAIDHGNLELDSRVREEGHDVYEKLRQERCLQQPYRDRRVHVTQRVSKTAVTYIVRDEGNGFDVSGVPDPTQADNLLRASGRGLMLIRTFMDEVILNDTGNEITMVKRRAAA